MNKVYGFTNENLNAFPEIYNFDNADVLTVLGSGDQYFQAILNNAKNVDVFDINFLTWYHFILKYTAIKVLSYEDFMQMFVTDNLDNLNIYGKLRPYLIDEVRLFFDKLINLQRKISSIKIVSHIFSNANIIPYFNKDKYYQLQTILQENKLPKFFNCDLQNLPKYLDTSYDIALFSNIYHYFNMTTKNYRCFLNQFHCDDILALYTWIIDEEEKNEFLINGFSINCIEGVLNENDYIISLKLKK